LVIQVEQNVPINGTYAARPRVCFNIVDLAGDVVFREPPDWPFANHVHRFVSGYGSRRSIHGSKPQADRHSPFDEPVILLQDIVQVRPWPTPAALPQLAADLQFPDSSWIGGMAIDIDDAWSPAVDSPQSHLQELFAATASRFGDNMKSMVSPVESTALYKLGPYAAHPDKRFVYARRAIGLPDIPLNSSVQFWRITEHPAANGGMIHADPRSAIISSKSRKVRQYRRYHRTHNTIT
jgi:hypothetical protein